MSETASTDQPTQTGDLGPMPEPEVEPREANPGGTDALPLDETNLPADLDPADNEALQSESSQAVTEAVSESDDTETQATAHESDAAAEDENPE